MKSNIHTYKSGDKIIPANMLSTVKAVLHEIDMKLSRRMASKIRETIINNLRYRHGWSGEVQISAKHKVTLTAKHGDTALCLQTGNMARFYADLLKLQAQFLDNKITAAIYILPVKNAAKKMGDNIANYERLVHELDNVFSKVITVPLVIIGFDENS